MRLFKNKKAQAALEFMMTYGWAILIVTTSVAALTFFMPSQKSLTNNKCIFGPAAPCIGSKLTADNLTVVLRNGMGQTMYDIRVNVTSPQVFGCAVSSTNLRAEERLEISCTNAGTMNLTTDSKIRMTLNYKKTRDGYDQSILGDLYSKFNS